MKKKIKIQPGTIFRDEFARQTDISILKCL